MIPAASRDTAPRADPAAGPTNAVVLHLPTMRMGQLPRDHSPGSLEDWVSEQSRNQSNQRFSSPTGNHLTRHMVRPSPSPSQCGKSPHLVATCNHLLPPPQISSQGNCSCRRFVGFPLYYTTPKPCVGSSLFKLIGASKAPCPTTSLSHRCRATTPTVCS